MKTVPFGDAQAAESAVSGRTAAFIMEPIQAENGCREAEKAYYAKIRSLCDRHGAKLIFDETQSGFGRTGSRFFFEQTGVEPDILIVGEAITGGIFPMTAMVFTPELKEFFDVHPLIHLCTYGGHDIGCRVAMSALDEYDRECPWDNARQRGTKLLETWAGSQARTPLSRRWGQRAPHLTEARFGQSRPFILRPRNEHGLLAIPAGGRIERRAEAEFADRERRSVIYRGYDCKGLNIALISPERRKTGAPSQQRPPP